MAAASLPKLVTGVVLFLCIAAAQEAVEEDMEIAQRPGPGGPNEPPEWVMWLDPVIRLVFYSSTLLVICMYFSCYIKGDSQKWMRATTAIPQKYRGKWEHGLCDCFQDIRLCCCACFCGLPVLSETWYRAGWSRAFIMSDDACTNYYGGCCLLCCLQVWCGLCGSCIHGAMRGGFTQSHGGWGGAIPLDLRFGMPSSALGSCCTWCWCGPCATCQEYKQVRSALNDPQTILEQQYQHPPSYAQQMPSYAVGGQQIQVPGQVMMVPAVSLTPPTPIRGAIGQPLMGQAVVGQPMMADQAMMGQPLVAQPMVGQPVIIQPSAPSMQTPGGFYSPSGEKVA